MARQPKAKTTSSEILDELKALNEQVEDLHELIDRTQRKQRKNRIANGILGGMFNAIGIVLGTLIITAVLLYFGQAFLRSDVFQNWLSEQLRESISEAASRQFRL